MNENDKNRQMIIYIICIIAVIILTMLRNISGEIAIGIISSIITYMAGRYTPYEGGK